MRAWLPVLYAVAVVAWLSTAPAGPAAAGARVETAHLVVIDVHKQLKASQLQNFAADAEAALLKAIAYWNLPDHRASKIILELYKEQSGRAFSIFQLESTADGKRSFVRVYGVKDPREMVHKLTHALFPASDKLIRNMMGIPTEARFGNRRSFPMCGYDVSAWSVAIRKAGSFIPLRDLGESHEDWGMTFQGNLPTVSDRKRQHASYAEAGSFGAFLLNRYGVNKVKAFYRASSGQQRPWNEVFGAELPALEAEWLKSIESAGDIPKATLDFLEALWRKNPRAACDQAADK